MIAHRGRNSSKDRRDRHDSQFNGSIRYAQRKIGIHSSESIQGREGKGGEDSGNVVMMMGFEMTVFWGEEDVLRYFLGMEIEVVSGKGGMVCAGNGTGVSWIFHR